MNFLKAHLKKILAGTVLIAGVGVGGVYFGDSEIPLDPNALDKTGVPIELQIKAEDKTKILESKEIDQFIKDEQTGEFINAGKVMSYDYITDKVVTKDLIFAEGDPYTNAEITGRQGATTTIKFHGGDKFYKNETGDVYEIEQGATTTIEAFDLQTKDNLVSRALKFLGHSALAACGDSGGSCYAGSPDNNIYTYQTNWTTGRSASSGTLAGWGSNVAECLTGKDSSAYYYVGRTFLPFDTSALPDTATISSVDLYAYKSLVSDDENDGNDFVVVIQTSQADPASLATTDFDNITLNSPDEGSSRLDLTGISAGAYQTFSLNATGLSWISKTGYTLLGIREGHDILNDTPAAGNGKYNQFQIQTSETTGTSQDPYLVISYTVPGGAAESVISPLMIF